MAMPWKETDVRKERVKLVLEWERQRSEGRPNVAELCRVFGISRDVGHGGSGAISLAGTMYARPRSVRVGRTTARWR